MMTDQEAKDTILGVRAEKGYSWFDNFIKELMRSRLQIDKANRPERVHATPSEKVKLYNRQGGFCPWRNPEKENPHRLTVPISKNDADHINVNVEGDEYNGLRNKQLLCHDCNLQKSAMTIQEQAVHQGKTFEQIIRVPVEPDV